MGETTYVMHPVAYASIYTVQEHPKESAMHAALSQSISFGRFMSESLSWERWSTFTSKKYVEEAERFSQPGSVAQKKAFFEAHYKGKSAKKPTLVSLQDPSLVVTSSPRNSPRPKLDPSLVVTSSPRNSLRPKLDTINEEEYQEEESNIKSTAILDELKAMANERADVAVEIVCLHEEPEMKFESPDRVTDTCDDKNEETGEIELNFHETKSNNEENEESSENEESYENEESSENEESFEIEESSENEESFEIEESSENEESFENEESSETSALEETYTEVVESQSQLDKQESMKTVLNEEPESESPCTEYHSLKQESVCSEEALVGSIEEDSCSSTPIDEKMTVTESPHKKKSTTRWLKPLRVTPTKEFNLFSLTVKNKQNKTRNSVEKVAANGASENCTAISGSKNNPKARSPTMFKQFWNKCSKKLLLSNFKLKNEEKARRKKEKLEKKPRKWGLTHCFKPSPYKKNHREKEKMEDHIKLIAMSRPYAAKSSKENHCNNNGSK